MTKKRRLKSAPPPQRRDDGWANLLGQVGLLGADKRLARTFNIDDSLQSQQYLEDLYSGDDLIARIIELVPNEMVREGIDFKCDGDPEIAKKVMTWVEDLQVMNRLHRAMIYARLYGGACVIMGVDDGQPSNMPLQPDKIKGFYWLTTLDRFSLRPDLPWSDPFSPRYGTPLYYFVQNQLATSQGEPTRFNDAVHATRLLRFDGVVTTPRRQQRYLTWGESILVRVLNTVADFQQVWGSVSYLMTDLSQAVFTIKNLSKALAAGQDGAIAKRFQLIEQSRSVARAVVLDSEETFERKATPLEGVPLILDRFANRLAAAVGIPVTLLMGEAPKGLNATGDADISNWFDSIHAAQEKLLRPALNRILTLALNAPNGPTGGKEPENWSFDFNSLYQLDGVQEAARRFSIAQADNIYLHAGVVTPEEIANSRFSADGYSIETNLDDEMRARLNDGSALGAMTKAMMHGGSAGPNTESSETGASRLDPQRMSQPSETEVIDADTNRSQKQTKNVATSKRKANENKTKHPPIGAMPDFRSQEDLNKAGNASGNVNEQEQKGALDFTGKEQPVTGSDYSSSEDEQAPMDFSGDENPATGANERGIALVPSETTPDEIERRQQRTPGGEGPIKPAKIRPKGSYGNTQSAEKNNKPKD